MSKGLLSLLRFIGVAFVLLIAFGIGQPFIWQLIVKEPPPAATAATLSSLLTIVIALLTLGIAAFGGGLYYILSRRIREETTRAAEREYIGTLVRLRSHVCALWGRLYEGLQKVVPTEQLTAFADQAVNYGKEANLDTGRLDVKTQEKLILHAKNNYAMALALKGDPGTAKEAAELVEYIREKMEKYPKEKRMFGDETVYFVAWRLPRKKNETLQAAKCFKEVWHQADEIHKLSWKRRWKQFPKGSL